MVRRKPRRKPLVRSENLRRVVAADRAILLEFWPRNHWAEVANWRKMLNAIIFRMPAAASGTNCPSGTDPRALSTTGPRRATAGIFERIWAVLVAECDELGGVQWEWQPADAMLGKARFGGKKTGKNPTDEEKGAPKRAW